MPSQVEALLLSVWRRAVLEGSGPELTLPEAAALLGTSVQSVRRRIKAGKLHAFRDGRGRVRVMASLPAERPVAPRPAAPKPNTEVAQLRQALGATKDELERTRIEVSGLKVDLGLAQTMRRSAQEELEQAEAQVRDLREELETLREALEYSEAQLASLWRVASARRERAEPAFIPQSNEAFDLPPDRSGLDSERARIQSQIAQVRDLSRRRRWPGQQAG